MTGPRIGIVGAGLSGLATAFYLKRALPGAELVVFEAEPAPGGKLQTDEVEGFRFEAGANGFLTNKPDSLRLVEDSGAAHYLLPSSDLARKRYIYTDRLHRMPESPPLFLKSRLLTWPQKLRVLGEFVVPARRDGGDETLREFGDRRLGPGFTSVFLDAMSAGIYGSTPEKIKALLDVYIALGIKRIVALRGDLPPGQDQAGHFLYANQLVTFIRQQTGDHFHIEVAAYPEKHPQAASIQDDLLHFKQKADAGANAAITQYFFNPDAYFHFVDDCAKLGDTIPIVPGIMPITNYKQLARFSEGCGAEIPRWIAARLEGYGEDLDAIRAFGLDVTLRLCETLLERGAPGLHFYTLNRTEPTRAIWEQLGL